MAAYGHTLVKGKSYQGVFNCLNALRSHLHTSQPVPVDRFEPDQEKFLTYREAVVADTVRAMGLLSRREWKAELDSAGARVQAAEKRVTAVTAPTPPPQSPRGRG